MGTTQKQCEYCGKDIPANKPANKFCNSHCAAKFFNARRKKNYTCKRCGKILKYWGPKFCSHECHVEQRYLDYIERWRVGKEKGGSWASISNYVRRWLIETKGEKCEVCGWNERHPQTGRVPVEVDHTDGNPLNHSENNLKLLCPNHHSLTPGYRALNKGNGRKQRVGLKL